MDKSAKYISFVFSIISFLTLLSCFPPGIIFLYAGALIGDDPTTVVWIVLVLLPIIFFANYKLFERFSNFITKVTPYLVAIYFLTIVYFVIDVQIMYYLWGPMRKGPTVNDEFLRWVSRVIFFR